MTDPLPNALVMTNGATPAVDDAAPAPRRGGRPKGWKKPAAEPAAVVPATPPEPGTCRGCEIAVAPMSLELVRELVRMARDRYDAAGGQASAPETDVRFLAARFDGYCSLGCYLSTRA